MSTLVPSLSSRLFQPSEIEQGKSFGWLMLDEEIHAMSILMVICASASAGDHDWCSQDCVKMCAHTHVRFPSKNVRRSVCALIIRQPCRPISHQANTFPVRK